MTTFEAGASGRSIGPGAIPASSLPLRGSTTIQGDVLAGFRKDHEQFLFLRVADEKSGRAWLADISPRVAATREVASFNERFSVARRHGGGTDPEAMAALWVGVSLTAAGLHEIAVDDPFGGLATDAFGAFRRGAHGSAERLGDVGEDAPERWLFGRPDQPIHAVLIVAADRLDDIGRELERQREAAARHGAYIVFEQSGGTLPGRRSGHEHFGFKDGISQPGVRGFDEADPAAADEVKGKPGVDLIAAGEFVLGHEDSQGVVPAAPGWMRDGSFQVIRRLGQDVPGWWAQVQGSATAVGSATLSADALAAKLVGRWRSGTPLALSAAVDSRAGLDRSRDNDFEYDDDPDGDHTPRFAHIRKVYPRKADPPGPGASVDRHRIIRRGIPFGLRFDPAQGRGFGVDAPRGLVFVAYMARIEDQFEFLQAAWANFAKFPEVVTNHDTPAADGPDPVIGQDAAGAAVRLRHGGQEIELALRRFVRTEGALYTFTPSLPVLTALATGTPLAQFAPTQPTATRPDPPPELASDQPTPKDRPIMPNGFIPIPDWFSWENQGAGVAVADLVNGRRDLVVLMVDNGPGQNRGVYRVGRDITADGVAAGGWGGWMDVPDWFPAENQGAGVAVADLDGDGRPELIVFMIDNPQGRNQGYYRIGRRLDTDGVVTGGWGRWTPIPDWFPWENQHGSVAVADLDHDGRPELVVLMIDNALQQNQGYYRVGRKLDAAGAVSGGWSGWQQVPDWFSWENQAAGVTVADLGTGTLDLLVYQVDNPLGLNQAYYRIGKNLGADGQAQHGWSAWTPVPNWFSHENAGGGIAVMTVDGKHELVVMLVDDPAGQNAGLYRVLDLDSDPATHGSWQDLPYHSGVLAVHTAVLPGGKVMFFAGSGNVKPRQESPDFGSVEKKIYTSVVWDPTVPPADGQGSFLHPEPIKGDNGKVFDFFCGGDTFLADGRLLSAGGTLAYPGHISGRSDAVVFDPTTQRWSRTGHMAGGRWYPTLVTLGDGRVFAASGLNENNGLNTGLEVYTPATGTWQHLGLPAHFPGLPLYPHLFLMADGRILFTGGQVEGPFVDIGPCLIDIAHDQVGLAFLHGLGNPGSRNQSASVLLPPAQDQRAMLIGGGTGEEGIDATAVVDVIDLKAAQPQFHPAAPLNLPRTHLNAVLLPDRTVLATGGGLKREFRPTATLQPEIYDPETDTWTIGAPSTVARLYHSVAVLLPDGRVAAAGGNPEPGGHVEWDNDPNEEMRLDVYSPPYLFSGPRPIIQNAPTEWHHGQTVDISSPQAGDIRWASLIKNAATTHSFDTGQRLVDLPITSQSAGVVRIEITTEPNIAPPGWYMLFLTDNRRIPSTAHWIHLTPA